MSHAQVIKLSRKILAAQRNLSEAQENHLRARTAESLVGFVEAKAFMAGLCKAMEFAAEQASVSMQGGWQNIIKATVYINKEASK